MPLTVKVCSFIIVFFFFLRTFDKSTEKKNCFSFSKLLNNYYFASTGAPVIFTQPHFLDADPEYTQYPEGLSPDREKHLTFVILEPVK